MTGAGLPQRALAAANRKSLFFSGARQEFMVVPFKEKTWS